MSVFSTKVLIGDIIFTFRPGDGTAIRCSSKPGEGLAICRAKEVASFLSHFKTLSVGQIPGIEPATSRSAVKRSTYRANPVAVTRTFRGISDKEPNVSENLRENDTKTYLARYNSVHWDFSRPLSGGLPFISSHPDYVISRIYFPGLPLRNLSAEPDYSTGQRNHNGLITRYVFLMFQFYSWFQSYFPFLFQTYLLLQMLLHYHTQKQRKIEFKPSLRLNDNHVFVATVLVYHATVFLCRHAMLLPQASRDHKKRLRWRVPAYRHLEQAEHRLVFYLFSSRKQKREEHLL